MKVRIALLSIVLLSVGIVAIFLVSESISPKKVILMSDHPINQTQPQIVAPEGELDSWKIPAIVPFNDEQRLYVSEVLAAMVSVITDSSRLEIEEKKILGPGRFRWPKNPDEPVKTLKSYLATNFRMAGIAASLQRKSENAPWSKAGLTVHPRNFPTGVYMMKLPSSVFKNFDLKKVIQEEREDERVKKPIVFYFEHKDVRGFTLRVEARADVASEHDSFPSSFHAIVITRDWLEETKRPNPLVVR